MSNILLIQYFTYLQGNYSLVREGDLTEQKCSIYCTNPAFRRQVRLPMAVAGRFKSSNKKIRRRTMIEIKKEEKKEQ